MYKAFNNCVIVTAQTDTNLQNQFLEGEVISTTQDTKDLQGKTIIASRRSFNELATIEGSNTTESGIILGDKSVYASVDIKDIVAVKDNK